MSYVDNLVALGASSVWRMDGSSSTEPDAVGANNGTWIATPVFGQRTLVTNEGHPSTYLNHSLGTGLNLGDIYDFTGSTLFTALVWIQMDAWDGATGYFAFANTDGSTRGWYLDFNAVFLIRAVRGDAAGLDTTSYTTSAAEMVGKTNMLAIAYDGTNLKIGLNGVYVASQPSPKTLVAPVTNTTMAIGKFGSGGNGFSGYMQYAAVFSGVSLTSDQLMSLYVAGIGGNFIESETQYGYAQPGRAGPALLRFIQGTIGKGRENLQTAYAMNDVVVVPTQRPPIQIVVSREAHRRSTRW